MIVAFWELVAYGRRHRVWLASLGLAAAINAMLLWLASLAPMGRLPGLDRPQTPAPVEIIMRRLVPPPPVLEPLAPAQSPLARLARLPPRFRPKAISLGAPPAPNNLPLPLPRLRLNLNPCEPAFDGEARDVQCAPPQEWPRADAWAQTVEDAAARGWIKPKPAARDRQSAMSEGADASAPELRGQLFKNPPFPPHAGMPQAAGP